MYTTNMRRLIPPIVREIEKILALFLSQNQSTHEPFGFLMGMGRNTMGEIDLAKIRTKPISRVKEIFAKTFVILFYYCVFYFARHINSMGVNNGMGVKNDDLNSHWSRRHGVQ